MKILSFVFLCVFAYLQYSLWFGNNNVNDYKTLNQTNQVQSAENEKLKQRNAKMFAEIHALSEEQSAVEERARNDIEMIKKDEHFYRIIIDKDNSKQ